MQWTEFRSHIGHLPAKDLKRIQKAFEMGKEAHDGQMRKSGDPYFTHPIAVALMLAEMGADADTLIAALLHDTIEDTDLTLQEVDNAFNGDVAALIDGVTKLEPEDFANRPALDDQIETLRKMFTEMQKDIRVMVIKLVDRLHNMQTAEHLPDARKRLLAQETLDVYVKIADRLSMQDVRDELEELCLAILDPPLLEKLIALRERNEAIAGKAIRNILRETERSSQSLNGIALIHENKSWRKLEAQLNAASSIVTGLSAVTVAFVCDTVDRCYATLGALHQSFLREAMSFQDFINVPMINGYKGLHTTILLKDGTRVRCKIRTEEMHRYARDGIATLCFESRAVGLRDYVLPWKDHISPVSEDTADRSTEFWESLQRDILGESIVIHGPHDQHIQIPKGSTVLDGAFYCFREKALQVREVILDGQPVPLHTPLTHAASLDVKLAENLTVTREWLHLVSTGFAIAKIREALAAQPTQKKRTDGKKILQDFLLERKKGFIEELDPKDLSRRLASLGCDSTAKAYTLIAEGHLDPEEVMHAIYDKHSAVRADDVGEQCTLRFAIPAHQHQAVMQLIQRYPRFRDSLRKTKVRSKGSDDAFFSFSGTLPHTEQEHLIRAVQELGGWGIEVVPRNIYGRFLLAIVIILWALNPVFAKWILLQGVEPLTLVTIRLLTFSIFTAAFYLIWKIMNRVHFSPIRGIAFHTMLPTIGMFALAVFTYQALLTMPPSVHITILRFNVFLVPLLFLAKRRGLFRHALLFLAFLCVAGLGMMLISPHDVLTMGVVFSLLALASYFFFSVSTEHVLQQHKIAMRYPAFLFQLGLILGIVGLLLVPLQSLRALLSPMTWIVVLYVLLCVCIPYACYSAVLKKMQFTHITNLFLFEVPLAMLFEVVILGIVLPPSAYLAIGVALAVLLGFGWMHRRFRFPSEA